MNPAAHDHVIQIRELVEEGDRVVFVSGDFNIVHPGHLRLFDFARNCGDLLVIGVNRDGFGNTVLPEDLRLEGVKGIGNVDYALILKTSPEDFIAELQPDVVVKGKEHETRLNPEREAVERYGGKLLFSSGEIRFSSLDLLQKELSGSSSFLINKPGGYLRRHNLTSECLVATVEKFRDLNVVVVGDLIVDEYITCDALGMSQEDPTLVVTPLKHDKFIGGAGIVAAHAHGLGAKVSYFAVCGRDKTAAFAAGKMNEYGVDATFVEDDSRPTSLKQRFRAQNKTLLRVSHLRQHGVSSGVSDSLYEHIVEHLEKADILIFSDFSYGCLPQELVDRLIAFCQENKIMMTADSQSSSQIGDVSRFPGMNLVTPTEHEARLATHDYGSGLVVLADALRAKAKSKNLVITLGAEGILIHAPHTSTDDIITDRLPAFNPLPKDVAGAGDSLLTCCSLSLAVGASIWQSAYIGSVAAACQVHRVGNHPLQAAMLVQEINN